MILEALNSSKFSPIPKGKLNAFRGGGQEIADSSSESEPLTTTVNGQQISFTYDCGYQYDDGRRLYQWYDANWNLLAEVWM